MVVNLIGQGPERHEVGVGSRPPLFERAPDNLATDEGLPCRGGRHDRPAAPLQDAAFDGPLGEREGHRLHHGPARVWEEGPD